MLLFLAIEIKKKVDVLILSTAVGVGWVTRGWGEPDWASASGAARGTGTAGMQCGISCGRKAAARLQERRMRKAAASWDTCTSTTNPAASQRAGNQPTRCAIAMFVALALPLFPPSFSVRPLPANAAACCRLGPQEPFPAPHSPVAPGAPCWGTPHPQPPAACRL